MKIPFVDLKSQYQSIKPAVDSAIREVIENTAFISGSYAEQFEKEFGKFLGLEHVVSCANGTDSLEILLKSMNIGDGDEVIVPAISWISTSEAVSAIGAKPVFVDVDEHFVLDPDHIEDYISPKTRAIIPVHLYGHPANMPVIMDIAKENELWVLEDCAQSHGATIDGKMVGTFGDCASFSFYPGKNLGAYGDAGAMATNNTEIAERARMICNHGQKGKHNHIIEGRNSRLDGIQAAVLSVKLPHLQSWTDNRIANASRYNRILNDELIELPRVRGKSKHVYHLYVIQTVHRNELMKHLENAGIGVGIHYPTPLPLLNAYRHMGHKASDFPMAYQLCESILSLPMFPEMTEEQQNYVAESVHSFHIK